MNKYGFILGREKELCKAEIICTLLRSGSEYNIIFDRYGVLIIETSFKDFDISKLGGTIKLFNILGEKVKKEKLKNFIKSNVEITQAEQRINFGISAYGKVQPNFVYAIGKNTKNDFVEDGFKARFVTGKFKDLSSVIVTENKLLERGFEVILVEDGDAFIVGQTISVQNYKSYSKRDYGRGNRDDKSGMLPPKLAQILVNLGSTSFEKTLYDPFVGSGTVIQEALVMGYQTVMGSDNSAKAVEDTNKNLEWLLSNEIVANKDLLQKEIYISDILSPSKKVCADLIVGEGYLGEPTRRNVAQAKNDAKNLSDFYLKAFSNIEKSLNAGGKAVIAIPFFIIGKERVFLPIIDKMKLTGLKIISIPDVTMTLRHSLLYSRPDSFVGREIFVLEKS